VSAMSPPYTGRCLCGGTRYRVTEEPLTIYACHCTDCQKRSGSAFGLSMWVHRAAIEVITGEATLHTSSTSDGRIRNGRICGHCGTRLWSEPQNRPNLAVVRPGTLDDTSWLQPVAHIWTRSAQPWFVFPEGIAKYATQPEDLLELASLWRSRGEHRGTTDAT
jgi:hypothetical protein